MTGGSRGGGMAKHRKSGTPNKNANYKAQSSREANAEEIATQRRKKGQTLTHSNPISAVRSFKPR